MFQLQYWSITVIFGQGAKFIIMELKKKVLRPSEYALNCQSVTEAYLWWSKNLFSILFLAPSHVWISVLNFCEILPMKKVNKLENYKLFTAFDPFCWHNENFFWPNHHSTISDLKKPIGCTFLAISYNGNFSKFLLYSKWVKKSDTIYNLASSNTYSDFMCLGLFATPPSAGKCEAGWVWGGRRRPAGASAR